MVMRALHRIRIFVVVTLVNISADVQVSQAFVAKSTTPVRLVPTANSFRHPDDRIETDDVSMASKKNEPLRVGIAGAGAIACSTCALLVQAGHDPMLWSPSGTAKVIDQEPLQVSGAMELEFTPRLAITAQQLAHENSVIILAIPANGHKNVMDEIAPHLREHHQIIISSHASFGALYLARLLQEGDKPLPPITAWGTTVCTARLPSQQTVRVNTIRTSVDLCTLPHIESESSRDLCKRLFPQVQMFRPRDGLLAISLSNLNPQNHLGIALCNMSRMEKGEQWYQLLNITPAVGRLLEALDRERLAIAEALNLETKTIFEHFSLSFHVPITENISEMNQQIHQLGNDVYGPTTAQSRYILEDVPFGLVPTIVLGRMVNRPAIIHEAGVQLVSAMYGVDFMAENDLLQALDLESVSLNELREASYSGLLKPRPSKSMTR